VFSSILSTLSSTVDGVRLKSYSHVKQEEEENDVALLDVFFRGDVVDVRARRVGRELSQREQRLGST